MNTRLELVPDRSAAEAPDAARGPGPDEPRTAPAGSERAPAFLAPPRGGAAVRLRRLLADERGAVTAEYAIVIMAAVAFAGLLVAIMRSDEIRAMLVRLVENALGTGG